MHNKEVMRPDMSPGKRQSVNETEASASGQHAVSVAHGHDHHHGHDHGHHHHHGHGHHHGEWKDLGHRALLGALAFNFFFMCVEGVTGVLTGSLALLSDAAHMFSDVLSLGIAALAAWIGQAAVRGRYTYGLRRVPVLGALFNAVSALLLGGLIVWEAIERLRAPQPVAGFPVLIVATLGLFVNIGSAWWLHRKGGDGVNTRGAMLHMVADALGSVAAILSGVVLLTTGWALIDPILSVLVAGIVITSSLPLLRDVLTILLQGAPGGLDLDSVRHSALDMPEVKEVIGLHAWELDSGEAVASFVLVTAEQDLSVLCQAADALRYTLETRFGVHHATVEWRDQTHRVPCCAPIAAVSESDS